MRNNSKADWIAKDKCSGAPLSAEDGASDEVKRPAICSGRYKAFKMLLCGSAVAQQVWNSRKGIAWNKFNAWVWTSREELKMKALE